MSQVKYLRFWRLFSLLLLFSSVVSAQGEAPLKVLFTGNSYTYFWNLPQTVQAMAEAKKMNMVTRQSTAGGVNWGQHWRGEKQLDTKELITNGDWDIVVMQNHSLSTIERPDSFMIFGEQLAGLVRASGAEPVLYVTWARAFNPLMQEKITRKYQELAEAIDAPLIPVGPAWESAGRLRPDLELFDPDGSHPSHLGTYLTACVFFRALTGQVAEGLPNRLTSKDKDGEKLYLTIVSPEDAVFLQQVADQIVSAFEEQKN